MSIAAVTFLSAPLFGGLLSDVTKLIDSDKNMCAIDEEDSNSFNRNLEAHALDLKTQKLHKEQRKKI